MNFTDNPKPYGQPRLFSTILVLLSVLAAYLLVGALLTMLATGGISLDDGFQGITGPAVLKMLVAQALGQIAVLALPVFWLVSRFTGDGLYGKRTLDWLGIGKQGGARDALMAGVGMLLLHERFSKSAEMWQQKRLQLDDAVQRGLQQQHSDPGHQRVARAPLLSDAEPVERSLAGQPVAGKTADEPEHRQREHRDLPESLCNQHLQNGRASDTLKTVIQ